MRNNLRKKTSNKRRGVFERTPVDFSLFFLPFSVNVSAMETVAHCSAVAMVREEQNMPSPFDRSLHPTQRFFFVCFFFFFFILIHVRFVCSHLYGSESRTSQRRGCHHLTHQVNQQGWIQRYKYWTVKQRVGGKCRD